ncbi:hypothetical protein BH23CHL7_BH23CHL7_07420 [soil metagenome]
MRGTHGFRALALVAMLALAGASVAACSGEPEPSPAELGAGIPTASAENGGIVVELWLDRQQVHAGDLVFALVRVSNQGELAIDREGNSCGTGPARTTVGRSADEVEAAEAEGVQWEGNAAEFKRRVLAGVGMGDGPRQLGIFWDARLAGEPVVCDLSSTSEPFGPGSIDQLLLAWRAVPAMGAELVPGPATVEATFVELDRLRDRGPLLSVTAAAPIEIVAADGAAAADPQPAEPLLPDYVDAALSSPEFIAWLEAVPSEFWRDTSVTYWPSEGGSYPPMAPYDRFSGRPIVEIGLHMQPPPGHPAGAGGVPEGAIRSVIVDRETLQVLAVRDPLLEP